MAAALTQAVNTAGRVPTAGLPITMGTHLNPITATTRAGRTHSGVMAYPQGITRIRIGAAIRTVVTTTTTRITRQRTVTTRQWLLCSGALANSVTITA